MDANGILDCGAFSSTVDECCVHIMNGPLAITSKGEAIGHVSSTILSKVESMLPLVRMFRVSVRHHHLRQRKSVENRPNSSLVIVCDIVEHNSLLVVEPNMNFPVLPVNHSSFHLK